jgi:isopentenyl phosphate kinase
MRKFIASLSTGMLLLSLAVAMAADLMSFTSVVDNLDLRKNTKLHVREYWKSIQNQQVSWSGEVIDVQGGAKSRVKLLVADKSRPLYKGYNLVITSYDVEKAANIRKGQKVRFTGTLSGYNAKHAGAVIEIADAQLQ